MVAWLNGSHRELIRILSYMVDGLDESFGRIRVSFSMCLGGGACNEGFEVFTPCFFVFHMNSIRRNRHWIVQGIVNPFDGAPPLKRISDRIFSKTGVPATPKVASLERFCQDLSIGVPCRQLRDRTYREIDFET